MRDKKVLLMPSTVEILETMGEQIRLARLRRDISMDLVSKRANISRATLYKIERGDQSVSMGHYAAALHALSGMDKDLLLIAKDDKLGRTIQDLNMTVRKRASKDDK